MIGANWPGITAQSARILSGSAASPRGAASVAAASATVAKRVRVMSVLPCPRSYLFAKPRLHRNRRQPDTRAQPGGRLGERIRTHQLSAAAASTRDLQPDGGPPAPVRPDAIPIHDAEPRQP